MARWIGIDYGLRRIGLALSDPGGRIASPAGRLDASGTPATDAQAVLGWAHQNEAEAIVVGLPLNMDGSCGAQALLSKELAEHLRAAGQARVELWDERLTSFQADQIMSAAGVRPAKQKRLRDALAAQLILQSFLDAQNRSHPPVPRQPPSP